MSSRQIKRSDTVFQELNALLYNTKKRRRRQEFLVQGVKPVERAIRNGSEITTILIGPEGVHSQWGHWVVDHSQGATIVQLEQELLDELAQKETRVELLIVCRLREAALQDLTVGPSDLIVACDRPRSPGNFGSLIRSADALGASAVLRVGHGCDPFDPRVIRASVGSVFSLPIVSVGGPAQISEWLNTVPTLSVVATDEEGDPIWAAPLKRPALILIGNEARGLSKGAQALATTTIGIPMGGSASSLNMVSAASIVLYEYRRRLLPS